MCKDDRFKRLPIAFAVLLAFFIGACCFASSDYPHNEILRELFLIGFIVMAFGIFFWALLALRND